MWIIIFLALVSTLILFNIIRVMIYGKSIYRPNFRRVDEILSAKTGFKSSWNTWYGKTIYYSLADGHVRSIMNQGLEHIEE